MTIRLLLLFEKEWDSGGLAPIVRAGELEVFTEGFDLFSFPDNARLITFDAWRFVDRMVAKYRGRIDAVLSGDEQFGTLIGAIIAERLGLPGPDARSIARAQHKFLCRTIQREATPEATIAAAPLPLALGDPRVRDPRVLSASVREIGLEFPLFVKPIKATFSVLARRVANAEELERHLSFSWYERLIIDRLVAPYAAIAARLLELPCDPTRMLLETPVEGRMVNLDGYAFAGDIRIIGMVDEIMYSRPVAGAEHFLRFDYPSKQPAAVRARLIDAATRVLRAIGFTNGFFCIEFFVTADGGVRFIEINPRLAVQFVGMYRDVEGLDIHRMMIAIATGRDPRGVPKLPVRAAVAASFVFRRFDGQPAPPARPEGVAWLKANHPSAELTTYHKHGGGLAREYKWLGSHRYALLNMSARDETSLFDAFAEACARLGWPCER